MIGVLVLLHALVYILLFTFFALLLPEWRTNVLYTHLHTAYYVYRPLIRVGSKKEDR